MSKPNKTLSWIPNNDPTKIITPPIGKQEAGWEIGERPPSQYFNYCWNMLSSWTNWLYQGKFDFDNTLESFLAGVSASDVGSSERSTFLGYQSADGTYNDIVAIGYNALSNPVAVGAGTVVIGVNAVDGVDLSNASLVFGYNNYQSIIFDYVQEVLFLDGDLQLSDDRGIFMSAFGAGFSIDGVGSAPNYYMELSGNNGSIGFSLTPAVPSYISGLWSLQGAFSFTDTSYLSFNMNGITNRFIEQAVYLDAYDPVTGWEGAYFGSRYNDVFHSRIWSLYDTLMVHGNIGFRGAIYSQARIGESYTVGAGRSLVNGGWALETFQNGSQFEFKMKFVNDLSFTLTAEWVRIALNSDRFTITRDNNSDTLFEIDGYNGYSYASQVYKAILGSEVLLQSVEGGLGYNTFARFSHQDLTNLDLYDRFGVFVFSDASIIIGASSSAQIEFMLDGTSVAWLNNDASWGRNFEVIDRLVVGGEIMLSSSSIAMPLVDNRATIGSDAHVVLDGSLGGSTELLSYLKLGSRKSFKKGDIVVVSVENFNGTLGIGHSDALPSNPTNYIQGTDGLIKSNGTFNTGTGGRVDVDCVGYGTWIFVCVTEDDGNGNIIFTPTLTGNLIL